MRQKQINHTQHYRSLTSRHEMKSRLLIGRFTYLPKGGSKEMNTNLQTIKTVRLMYCIKLPALHQLLV